MKRSLLAAVAAALLTATSAQAQETTTRFYDGAKMHEFCSNDRSRTICLGYAAGLADALEESNVICLPRQVKLGSVADVIERELVNHPELRHYAAASIATIALRKAFPCPGQP
jgi:Rap1a immunity proteins